MYNNVQITKYQIQSKTENEMFRLAVKCLHFEPSTICFCKKFTELSVHFVFKTLSLAETLM